MSLKTVTLVTGNKHKLREFGRLFPKDFSYTHKAVDLDEIQSFDSTVIITDKAHRAYAIIGSAVIVEDVTAGLACLSGLPGPFIKYFEERMGQEALYLLANDDKRATITCNIGYYDGSKLIIGTGVVEGTVVQARADTGFGFDNVFVPNGSTQTFAEMGDELKDVIGHRGLAVKDLLDKLDYTININSIEK